MASSLCSREGGSPDRVPAFAGTQGSLGHHALRLAGLAGALLGWRADEFWSATPAELAAVLGAMSTDDVPADAGKLLALKEMFPDG